MQNHLVDPTFFFDAIEEFSFDYTIIVPVELNVEQAGKQNFKYMKQTIRGSLQSGGKSVNRSLEGNTVSHSYDFYCKALYRIDTDSYIIYNNTCLLVTSVNDYDEFGVRSCHLESVDINKNRDLRDYIKYLIGEKLI